MEADEAEYDRRDTDQQLDQGLEHLLAKLGLNLDREDGRPDGDGQGDGGGEHHDRERRHDQGKGTGEGHTVLLRVMQVPRGTGKELDNVDAVFEKGRQSLLSNHENQRTHNECHERDARTRDTQAHFFQVALWHLTCHHASFLF